MTINGTEVYALRYASRPNNTTIHSYYRLEIYNEADSVNGMDYFIWVVRQGSSVVVVDCGFDERRGAARDRFWTTAPETLLARIGVKPEEVETVVLTHLHFDHSGNIDMFPNSQFLMSTAEYEYWTGPYGDRPAIRWPAESVEVQQVQELRTSGRLELIDSEMTILPGVKLMTLPGHTPGQMIVEVTTPDKTILLTSDAMHYYDEIDLDRPFYIYEDLRSMFRAYEYLREREREPDLVLVPGHDPAVMSEYAEVAPECIDLTVPTNTASSRNTPGNPQTNIP